MPRISYNTMNQLRELEELAIRVGSEVEYEVLHSPDSVVKANLAHQAIVLAAVQIAGATRLLEEFSE